MQNMIETELILRLVEINDMYVSRRLIACDMTFAHRCVG
jgi:hypothetical protein